MPQCPDCNARGFNSIVNHRKKCAAYILRQENQRGDALKQGKLDMALLEARWASTDTAPVSSNVNLTEH